MKRVLACTALVSAIATGGWLASGFAAAQGPTRVLEVKLGDKIHVVDAPLGCQVVRMRDLGGRVALDCRRAGALAGTYGTLITSREAALMRFQSKRIAKLVVVAPHEQRVQRCN